jgi:hypothetical protein
MSRRHNRRQHRKPGPAIGAAEDQATRVGLSRDEFTIWFRGRFVQCFNREPTYDEIDQEWRNHDR